MKPNELLIMRDRKYALTPGYWNGITQTGLQSKQLYGVTFTRYFIFCIGERKLTVFDRREWDRISSRVAKKLFSSPAYFKKIEQTVRQNRQRVEQYLAELERRSPWPPDSAAEIIREAGIVRDMWLHYDHASVFAWFVGGDRFHERVRNALQVPAEPFKLLALPKTPTAASALEYEQAKSALTVLQGKKTLATASQQLAKEFSWIPFGYDGPNIWDEAHFARRLARDVKQGRRILARRLHEITAQQKRLRAQMRKAEQSHIQTVGHARHVRALRLLAEWTDERKRIEYQLHIRYAELMRGLAKRIRLPRSHLMNVFTEELTLAIENPARAKETVNKRLRENFAIAFLNGQWTVLPKQRSQALIRAYLARNQSKVLKGEVASTGPNTVYRGRVRVLAAAGESNKVKAGEFIVAAMTTPEYAAAMHRAAGFITDEGGVTCHAAIVAREMNKPCIIGTKNATKALKNGDMVEVDATKGIVRKL